jgi:hypothetical protein
LVLAAFSSLRLVVRKRTMSFLGPSDQGAVTENLIVLDSPRTRHDRGVEHGLVLDLVGADAIVK